ncbi:MAG TPA: inositol monophosphatase family protein [Gemmataceae bacterium]|nr:inositol monophosphatase family protein [Gemmataceae bacterium]
MPHDAELDAALDAARQAGLKLKTLYEDFKAIPNAPADISTEADRQSQEIVLKLLRAKFPGDAFCAEEETASLAGMPRVGSRLWIVDPIDGTRGFARKNGEFSVMIGFVERGRPVVGVVLEPAKDRVTYAIAGGGCWRRDGAERAAPCQVTTTANLSATTLTQSHSRDPNKRSKETEALNPARIVETYSAGIKLAQVARGEADIYLNTYENFHDWDIAAGHVLVTEAGGTVTGLKGQELRYGEAGAWQRHGLLGTNGKIHAAAVAALSTI